MRSTLPEIIFIAISSICLYSFINSISLMTIRNLHNFELVENSNIPKYITVFESKYN